MKAGRPSFHIKAHWITFIKMDGESIDYKLDKYGCLIKNENVITASRELAEDTIKDDRDYNSSKNKTDKETNSPINDLLEENNWNDDQGFLFFSDDLQFDEGMDWFN